MSDALTALTDATFDEEVNAADVPVRAYSLGMRRKLLLARALLHRPAVLYLDDVTGEPSVVGVFAASVPLDEVIDTVVANAEVGDWIIADGEPLIVDGME